jgi:hypothetical protein
MSRWQHFLHTNQPRLPLEHQIELKPIGRPGVGREATSLFAINLYSHGDFKDVRLPHFLQGDKAAFI